MKIELKIYKCGMGNFFWSYWIKINGKEIKHKPLIYRMWDKEKTALKNGIKAISKITTNAPSKHKPLKKQKG